MLARHAESLFWGAATSSAPRTPRACSTSPTTACSSRRRGRPSAAWQDLLRCSGLDAAFAELEHEVRAGHRVSEFLVLDPDNPGAIVSARRAAPARTPGASAS